MLFTLVLLTQIIATGFVLASPQNLFESFGAGLPQAQGAGGELFREIAPQFAVLKNLSKSVQQQLETAFAPVPDNLKKTLAEFNDQVKQVLKNSGTPGADTAYDNIVNAVKNFKIQKVKDFINSQTNETVKQDANNFLNNVVENESLTLQQLCEASINFVMGLTPEARKEFTQIVNGGGLGFNKCMANAYQSGPSVVGDVSGVQGGQPQQQQDNSGAPPPAGANFNANFICSHLQEIAMKMRENFKECMTKEQQPQQAIAAGGSPA